MIFCRPADPHVQRTRTGAWLVKGGGPTRRYSTKRQATHAVARRQRFRRAHALAADLAAGIIGRAELRSELIDPSWHTIGAAASRPYIGAGVDFRALLPRPDPAALEAELCKIPGVVSATVRFNIPESVEILGTVTITGLVEVDGAVTPNDTTHITTGPDGDPVHWCDWADQPEVRIFCTQQGSTPDSSGEFRTVRGDRYTFNREEATCPRCRPC